MNTGFYDCLECFVELDASLLSEAQAYLIGTFSVLSSLPWFSFPRVPEFEQTCSASGTEVTSLTLAVPASPSYTWYGTSTAASSASSTAGVKSTAGSQATRNDGSHRFPISTSVVLGALGLVLVGFGL